MNYLDKTGLTHLWDKIKAYVDNAVANAGTGSIDTSNLFTVKELTISVPAVNAHSYTSNTNYTFTPPTGYKAVGVVGWRSSNYRIIMSTAYINSDGNVNATFVNHTASNAASTTTARVEVLCVKQ